MSLNFFYSGRKKFYMQLPWYVTAELPECLRVRPVYF